MIVGVKYIAIVGYTARMLNDYDIREFDREFPDDDTCLEWLKDQVFPEGIFCDPCGRVTKHHRVRSRRSYSCDRCGRHVHPTAGTIYHKSRTPLTKWFYATYLLSTVDPNIPITELQRELGVTYKTAWRMTHLILSMLDDDDGSTSEPALRPVKADGPARASRSRAGVLSRRSPPRRSA